MISTRDPPVRRTRHLRRRHHPAAWPRAPTIEVEGALPHGGAVYESEICEQLHEALTDDDRPAADQHLGRHPHPRQPRRSSGSRSSPRTTASPTAPRALVVAAAGNDELDEKFYPAAFPWVVSVGALDEAGNVAELLQLRRLGGRLGTRQQPGQRVPRGHLPAATRTRRTTGQTPQLQAAWRSGAARRSPPPSSPAPSPPQMSATGNTDDPRKAYDQIEAPSSAEVHGPEGRTASKHLGPSD